MGDPGVGVTKEREPIDPERGESTPAAPPARRRLELVLDSIPPAAPSEAPPAGARNGSAPPPPSTVHNRVATSVLTGRVELGSVEARVIRSLAGWIGLTGVATLAISGICAAQWATGRASVPSAVAAVLTGAIGLWSVLGGWHLGRVVAKKRHDAHQLVRSFSNLRSIFILRAVALFFSLALSCFAFSIVASLLALL